MAKRGRKPLLEKIVIDYTKIKCSHCGNQIENNDGHPDYTTISIWKVIDGVNWPATVRLHRECLEEFIEQNFDKLYGLVQKL